MKYQKMMPPTSVDPVKKTAMPVVWIAMETDSARSWPRLRSLTTRSMMYSA